MPIIVLKWQSGMWSYDFDVSNNILSVKNRSNILSIIFRNIIQKILILGSLGAEITLFMNIPPPLSWLLRYGSQRQIKGMQLLIVLCVT